jgi:hypothetical protein
MPLAGLADGAAESGLRIISNRRDAEQNWVLNFYNRVRDHASRHYGRSYVAEGLLYNEDAGWYRLIDSAWCNVENQVEGFPLSASGVTTDLPGNGVFVEDYEINRDLGPISPFVTRDFRVRAHVVLPADTLYGPRGDDNPASFGNWTEDAPPFNPDGDGSHYIPVSLTVVGSRVVDPRSDDLYSFEDYPEGTVWCQLPTNAGPSGDLTRDTTIANLQTMLTTNNQLAASGLFDLTDFALNLNSYDELTKVAVPVQARIRYGQEYPSQWYLGDIHYERDEDVQLDDQFVPWAFSPAGNDTSLEVMTDRAVHRIQGKIVPKSSSRYADFQQIGLPLLSFDSFARQNIGPSGLYGEISHGVSELNISFGIEGFQTRYKIQSYFPQFGREAPLGERLRVQLNGIINPIDFSDLELLNPRPPFPDDPLLPDQVIPPPSIVNNVENSIRVAIVEVNNKFTLNSTPGSEEPERYRGIDQHGYIKPPSFPGSSDPDFDEGALCIDGFLNIDDQCLYHTDSLELPDGTLVLRYFTQGRPFGHATIVEVERNNAINGNFFDVTIVEDSSTANEDRRAIFGLDVLNGSVNVGEKTTLAVQGDARVTPGVNTGDAIFLNGTVTAGVTPVQIITVTSFGLENARATCVSLDTDGTISASGTTFADVRPIPFPQFAGSGDRGYLSTVSIPSGGGNANVNFIEIVKPAFFTFGNAI